MLARENRCLLFGCFSLLLLFVALPAGAASPSSGSVGATVGTSASWTGDAIGGVTLDESTCTEGITCDTFTLTVNGVATDWSGKQVTVKITWTDPLNDYDLYVHKDSNSGPLIGKSASGAPGTSESVAIDPGATGTGVYTIHVVYFSVTPLVDEYKGTATVENKPATRTATYIKGGMTFSPSVAVRAPVAARDGEPSSRTDKFGNHYVTGIRGVPAGVDLWYFDLQPGSPTYDPKMRNPIYRGQPDSFTESNAASVGADGGGDVDIAVGFQGNNPPTLASSSLVAANISTQRSTDRGITFTKNPAGNVTGGVPVDDRQWLEFFGANQVYLLYRTIAPAVTQIQRSTDGGLTYGPAATAGAIGQVGSIDVDQNDGTVYISGSSGRVCVGTPPGLGLEPLTYTCHVAASDPNGVAHLFFIVKVADDGTVYVAYSNDKDVYLAHSTDKGGTWSLPVRVSDAPGTNIFPALETGPLPGSVGVAWYGTSELTNNNNANWQVYFAQSLNAKDPSPTFRQVVAGDHFIHGSNISEGGTLGNANRNLLDYFQISFDPTGAAVIDYTDDHNDFDGHTYVMRQISGPSVAGGSVPVPNEGKNLPPPPPQPADGSQVVDFAKDVADALLVVVSNNDPLDILSIRYSCENGSDGQPVIVATMKVSDLSSIPAASNWRMNFTANAPFTQLSPTGDYSFGLSDRGDQFFVRATTDALGAKSFSYGTAVRNSDGSITYSTKGAADGGSFDTTINTITVKVSVSKLNPLVTHGPPIGVGSTLAGLRGQTFTAGVNAKRDIARGGTQFTIGSCAPAGPPGGGGPPGTGPIVKVTGGGSIDAKIRSFTINADRSLSGHVHYRDSMENFEMVSTSITSFAQTGPNQVTFSGTGTVDRDPVNFEIVVEDNGEPGTNDFFKITITGARNSSHSGNLSQGNIEAHR